MRYQTRDDVAGIIGIAACMLVSIMWYHAYVGPQDAARRDIMACMAGDNSEESYQGCYNKLNPRK
jgi:hypothetical protein